jgi:hypothetical protein
MGPKYGASLARFGGYLKIDSWEASVLPLNYTRIDVPLIRLEKGKWRLSGGYPSSSFCGFLPKQRFYSGLACLQRDVAHVHNPTSGGVSPSN